MREPSVHPRVHLGYMPFDAFLGLLGAVEGLHDRASRDHELFTVVEQDGFEGEQPLVSADLTSNVRDALHRTHLIVQ
jgi:hypothetical protein